MARDNARDERPEVTMKRALEAIAGMQVDKNTNHRELSALCIAIAKIELGRLA